MDLTASDTAQLTGISLRLRQRMAEECERQSPFAGELEADESYFGARRVRGKRGRGASGKTIVFGLLKHGDSVYTEDCPGCLESHAASHYPG